MKNYIFVAVNRTKWNRKRKYFHSTPKKFLKTLPKCKRKWYSVDVISNTYNCRNGGNGMAAIDVAKYLLSKGPMTHKKLQKLCYYCQGWHIALFGEEMFTEPIEAWIHGPVVASLYPTFADWGWDEIPQRNLKDWNLTEKQKVTIDAVWNAYGKFDGNELEVLSHSEDPWKTARGSLKPYEPSNKVIGRELLEPFFKRLAAESQDA